MLRALLLFGFLLAIFFKSFSQQYPFNAALFAGLQATQVDGDQLDGFNKIGISVGGAVQRNLTARWALQMELGYNQKGSRRPLNASDNTFFFMRLNYVEVPLMVQFEIDKSWRLQAGPSVASIVSSRVEDESGIIRDSPVFRKTDMLINGGACYQLSERWLFVARYCYSVRSIREIRTDYHYYYSGKQFNKAVVIQLQFWI